MNKSNKSFWMTSQGLAALVFISFPAYFLFIEHREHVFQFLPYLILLLCPLMHVFMHRGHHHTPDHDSFEEETKKNEAYRDGYIEGLKTAREEKAHKENDNAR